MLWSNLFTVATSGRAKLEKSSTILTDLLPQVVFCWSMTASPNVSVVNSVDSTLILNRISNRKVFFSSTFPSSDTWFFFVLKFLWQRKWKGGKLDIKRIRLFMEIGWGVFCRIGRKFSIRKSKSHFKRAEQERGNFGRRELLGRGERNCRERERGRAPWWIRIVSSSFLLSAAWLERETETERDHLFLSWFSVLFICFYIANHL